MHASAVGRAKPRPLRGLARSAAALALLVPSALFLNVPEAEASLQARGFTPRFSTNAQGAIALVGNTLASCATGATSGGATCAQARNGTAVPVGNNNSWTMVAAVAGTDPPAAGPTATQRSTPPPTVGSSTPPEEPMDARWLAMVALALAILGVMAGWSRMERRGPRRR